jgi:hypothetical protein
MWMNVSANMDGVVPCCADDDVYFMFLSCVIDEAGWSYALHELSKDRYVFLR